MILSQIMLDYAFLAPTLSRSLTFIAYVQQHYSTLIFFDAVMGYSDLQLAGDVMQKRRC